MILRQMTTESTRIECIVNCRSSLSTIFASHNKTNDDILIYISSKFLEFGIEKPSIPILILIPKSSNFCLRFQLWTTEFFTNWNGGKNFLDSWNFCTPILFLYVSLLKIYLYFFVVNTNIYWRLEKFSCNTWIVVSCEKYWNFFKKILKYFEL